MLRYRSEIPDHVVMRERWSPTHCLGLGELYDIQFKDDFQDKTWTCSQVAEEKDGKYTDPVTGVSILLSKGFASKVLSSGCVGSRTTLWARIEDPICNLFVIVVYAPHKGRVNPSAHDTISQIKELLIIMRRCERLCNVDDRF